MFADPFRETGASIYSRRLKWKAVCFAIVWVFLLAAAAAASVDHSCQAAIATS